MIGRRYVGCQTLSDLLFIIKRIVREDNEVVREYVSKKLRMSVEGQEAPVVSTSVASGTVRGADRLAVLALILAVLLAVLDYAVVNVALPALSAALRATAAQSVWVVNSYQISSCSMLLPAGALAERWGARRLCLAGLSILIGGSVACAAANSVLALSLARVVQGIGGAAVLAVSADLFRSVYPKERIGRALATASMTASLAVALGPSVAAIVLHFMSWRGLFLFNIPFGFCALWLGRRHIPAEEPGRKARKVRLRAVCLNAVAFSAILMARSFLAHGGNGAAGGAALFFGLAALILFVLIERGEELPLLPVDLLRRKPFAVAGMTCFLGYVAANFFMVAAPFALTGGRAARSRKGDC